MVDAMTPHQRSQPQLLLRDGIFLRSLKTRTPLWHSARSTPATAALIPGYHWQTSAGEQKKFFLPLYILGSLAGANESNWKKKWIKGRKTVSITYLSTHSSLQRKMWFKEVARWMRLLDHLSLHKGKGVWRFWEEEASYGKVARKVQ